MGHQLSDFELDLLFIAASFKHGGEYKEDHWQKLEERLNRIETCLNSEHKSCGKIEQTRFWNIFKLKCKLFKK